MTSETLSWGLIFLGLLAILLELLVGVATGFDLVLMGISLMVGGGVGLWTSWEWGFLTGILLCVAYVVFGRRLVHKKLAITTHQTNVDILMGQKGEVWKEIGPTKAGQVKVGTEVWRAVNGDLEQLDILYVGERIKVQSVEGVTLKVEKL